VKWLLSWAPLLSSHLMSVETSTTQNVLESSIRMFSSKIRHPRLVDYAMIMTQASVEVEKT
jgi:hypothetical protein